MRVSIAGLVMLVVTAVGCTAAPSTREAVTAAPVTAASHSDTPRAPPTEPPDRHADLQAVVDEYEATHPSPPPDLQRRVDALAARAEDLSPDEFLVEVMRLTGGRDRDGHTGVFPLAQPELGIWPLQLYDFDDGWRVVRARRPYQHLVGGRVTEVGGRPIGEVARTVMPLVSRDNAATVRGRLPQYLVVPAVLRGLGLEPTLTIDGERITPTEISTEAYATWTGIFYPLVCPRLRPPSEPDWRIDRTDDAVVARYGLVSNFVGNQAMSVFADGIDRLATRVSGPVVIDIRDNPGGDNGTYNSLLATLEQIAKREPGRLRIVFGRCTFSAATNFVAELVAATNAVTYGEPMGGSPNMWGDADESTLPASGIVLHMATVEWELGGRDRRSTIPPDVATPLRWQDHRRGVDRAVEAALR